MIFVEVIRPFRLESPDAVGRRDGDPAGFLLHQHGIEFALGDQDLGARYRFCQTFRPPQSSLAIAGPVKGLGLFLGVMEPDAAQGPGFVEYREGVAFPADAPAHPILDQAFFVEASFLSEELDDLRGVRFF